MSKSFIHALSFMHEAGHAIPGSCGNGKTTAALLTWIKKLILSPHLSAGADCLR
jgi:hypothetical protein